MVTAQQLQIAIKNPEIFVMPFHQTHIPRLDLMPEDIRTLKALGDGTLKDLFAALQSSDTTFTVFYRQQPLLVLGYEQRWKGSAEIWLLPSRHISDIPRVVAKGSLRVFNQLAAILHCRRLQLVVDATRPKAIRFAKFCKFEIEGHMKQYGPEGHDYLMFARLF